MDCLQPAPHQRAAQVGIGADIPHHAAAKSRAVGHQEVFAEGWLQSGESVWGRPADVLPLPDGSVLISDDYAGAVYRVTYSAP